MLRLSKHGAGFFNRLLRLQLRGGAQRHFGTITEPPYQRLAFFPGEAESAHIRDTKPCDHLTEHRVLASRKIAVQHDLLGTTRVNPTRLGGHHN